MPGDDDDARTNFTEVGRWVREADKALRIRGRAHTHQGGQVAMTIKTFEVVEQQDK